MTQARSETARLLRLLAACVLMTLLAAPSLASDDSSPRLFGPKPAVGFARIPSEPPSQGGASICDKAAAAQARNAPDAQALEQQCKAFIQSERADAPQLVAPGHGHVYRPLTALAIRVAPKTKEAPWSRGPDTSYQIEIQVQANFAWRSMAAPYVDAAVAESPAGYRGWGAPQGATPSNMAAIEGTYRVRVRSWAPRVSPRAGHWVEFKIAGMPGDSAGALTRKKPAPTASPAAGLGIGTSATTKAVPRAQQPATALPPSTLAGARLASPAQALTQATPPTATNKAGPALFNTPAQPMAAPLAPTAQAPSALR